MYTPDQTRKTIQRALSPQEQLSRDKLRRVILLSNLTAGAGGGSAATWTPGSITGLTYFLPSPATCFTDAGTTPAAVGDLVYDFVSSYGPSRTLRQATLGDRLILRQTAGGKYYLEGAVGKTMTGTVNETTANGQAFTLAWSGRTTADADQGYVSVDDGALSQSRIILTEGGLRSFGTRGGGPTYGPPDVIADQSWVCSGTGVTSSNPALYLNGVSQTASGGPPTYGGGSAPFMLGIQAAVYAVATRSYGLGFRLGTAVLTAGEVASLNTFQQSLYA